MKLTKLQAETMEFCWGKMEAARQADGEEATREVLDAQKGVVYTQGGKYTARTLRALEKKGLLEILEDNSGIGIGGAGAFPSKVRVLRDRFDYGVQAPARKAPRPKRRTVGVDMPAFRMVDGEVVKTFEERPFEVVCDDDGNILTDIGLLRFLYDVRWVKRFPVMVTDRALVSMATYKPATREEFVSLAGLGEKVYEKCGEAFMEAIRDYAEHAARQEPQKQE